MRIRTIAIMLVLLLAGCAEMPREVPLNAALFSDQRFAVPAQSLGAEDPFAISRAMQRYLDSTDNPIRRSKNVQKALFEALYLKGELKLDYDASMTRNAAQTFDVRSGNCLSLVIMTAAFAKQLGLVVSYNLVDVEQTWVRNANLRLAVGHVNLTLGKRQLDTRRFGNYTDLMTIDFLPSEDASRLHSREISEATVVAMYMNNRAVESLADGKTDQAYWWARGAIVRDPSFLSAYDSLGVIYQRHADLAEASAVNTYVLAIDPGNTTAMWNQIDVLKRSGRIAEAQSMAQTLHTLQPNQPFQFFDAGLAAMRRADYEAARQLFTKELARDPDFAEGQYWLGSAYAKLGDVAQANRYLHGAIDNSTTAYSHDLYVAKLRRLKSGVLH